MTDCLDKSSFLRPEQIATTSSDADSWTVDDSAELYNITGWGEPYLGINRAGNITVTTKAGETAYDLAEIVNIAIARGIKLPISIRFPEILADRIAHLHGCMAKAIADYGYSGSYQGVFPIKCNQNRQFVESVVEYGKPYQFGLEAGSKAELIIALACLSDEEPQPLLLCNGYKDRHYVETALLATKLGQKIVVIIEQPQELDFVLSVAEELQVEPTIGIRAKLNIKGIGRWGDSTGELAKFGLSVAEILQLVSCLSAEGKLHWLQLLHFHIGSQISAIGKIKDAIKEASQIYVQLAKLGANMQYLDAGGGLGVDYDGSKTDVPASKNYSVQNYANDLIAQIVDACDRVGVAHPILITESGRAISAHQAILIFEVLNTSNTSDSEIEPPPADAPLAIKNFWTTYRGINSNNLQESYHDAIQFQQEALSLFNLGYLSLVERGIAEQLYYACCDKISHLVRYSDRLPDELAQLSPRKTTYYANFSIFRSAPDAWAIQQLFPIMPIHRLQEQPKVKGILADITCDSDGKIDRFIDRQGTKPVLELHTLSSNSAKYYLGMFLMGAYQEIMGNLHNLFGNTEIIQVKTTAKELQIESVVRGDCVDDVLSRVGYDREALIEIISDRARTAVQNRLLTPGEAHNILQNYIERLHSSTYLGS